MIAWVRKYATAATRPAAGSVTTQATTMLPATPQRTADSRRVAPTPMIEAVVTCVVETGTANTVAVAISTPEATVWAANPPVGVSWMIRLPRVRMIRKPPAYVPALIARAEARMTHSGTSKESSSPEVTRARVMMPMVFCASWVPWPNAIVAELTICAYRKPRCALCALVRRNDHRSASMKRYPRPNPISGDSTIGMTTLSTIPSHFTDSLAASAAPTRPPISAWEEDEGSPKYQVIRFQTMAPISAANTTCRPPVPVGGSMMPAPTVAATLVEMSAPTRFITAARPRAARGVSALVETATAIALAASWKPLV